MLLKITRTLLSLCLLFAMLYLGKGLSTSLVIGIVKVEWVTPAARPLTRYMTIFFIPICAEIVEHVDILKSHFVSFVLANMLSTMVSLVLIGLFAQWVFHRK